MRKIKLTILAVIMLVYPALVLAEPLSLKQLERDRQQLLIDVRQFEHKVQEETKLFAIKQRNVLLSQVNELESSFSDSAFGAIREKAEWIMLALDSDPEAISGYYDLAVLIISRVEPGQTLKESYGIAHKSDLERDKAVAEFRKGLKENISISFLRHMLMEDPVKGVEGFRAYTNALRHYQAAEQFRTEAQSMELAADQQLARDIASGVPLLGDAIDIVGIATGEDAFTGEKLSSALNKTPDQLMAISKKIQK
jgi:hypothetical protein